MPKPEEPVGPRVYDPLLDAPTDPLLTGETDAERALRSIYPDLALANEIPNISGNQAGPSTVPVDENAEFDAAVALFAESPTVDYFETQQRYGMGQARSNGNQLSQQSNARTETSTAPYSLAQVQEADAENSAGHEATDDQADGQATNEQNEELRQRAIAIVSSIQPQGGSV
jgi:hypothetical protein